MPKKGSFVIRLKNGEIASHLIEIEGILYRKIEWEEETIKDFIEYKIDQIDDFYCAEIEFFQIEMSKKTLIKIKAFIASLNSIRLIDEWSREWLKNHIGTFARITKLEVKAISTLARSLEEYGTSQD